MGFEEGFNCSHIPPVTPFLIFLRPRYVMGSKVVSKNLSRSHKVRNHMGAKIVLLLSAYICQRLQEYPFIERQSYDEYPSDRYDPHRKQEPNPDHAFVSDSDFERLRRQCLGTTPVPFSSEAGRLLRNDSQSGGIESNSVSH